MNSLLSKSELRSQMRKSLSLMGSERKKEHSQEILSHLLKWLEQHPKIQKIGLYAALPSEIDLSQVLLLRPGLEWYFPTVKNASEMSFHRVNELSSLEKGFAGILEPNPQVHPPIDGCALDLILCPGLAFNENGYRLGRGGGFFDRYLENCHQNTTLIGIGYKLQFGKNFLTEAHDIPMHSLLNEAGLHKVDEFIPS